MLDRFDLLDVCVIEWMRRQWLENVLIYNTYAVKLIFTAISQLHWHGYANIYVFSLCSQITDVRE